MSATTTAFGLFGLFRLPWVESHLVLPLTRMQGEIAASAFQTPAAPISVTLACSGTEVIAMCLGAVLAYPAAWRGRLSGAVLIVMGILGLNTVRIGTLGLAADDPQWFNVLHLYLWPAAMMLVTSGAVFVWMRHADRASTNAWSPSWQFVSLACVLLVLSAVTAPVYITSDAVYLAGRSIAHAAAMSLSAVGVETHATGNVLWTVRGGFSVTGDCVATPLVPLYFAAVWVYASTWPRRLIGTALAVPIFFGLGVIRLLLVALPQSLAPVPEFASHTFYQVVLATVVIALAGRWRHGPRAAGMPVAAGIVVAALFVVLAGQWYAAAVMTAVQPPLIDPQGALALLPPFQVGLFAGLWIAAGVGHLRVLFVCGLGTLILSHLLGAWWLAQPGVPEALAGHVTLVRGWAVAAPPLICGAIVALAAHRASRGCVQNSTVSPS